MGKPGEFLKKDRKEAGYRPESDRVRDFEPVEMRLSEEDLREQASRCMDCGIPFCHGAGCPVVNVIPEFNDLAYRGKWKEALDILLATNPFPEFTARVCPAPCETACVLDVNDKAITIREIELAIVEKGFEKGYLVPSPPAIRLNTAAAVIGSGPAGLAVAQELNRFGHRVTVFDSELKAGGILRYGIPDFKLDKSVVQRRIDLMSAEGVIFETNVRVGKDVSHKYLRDRFDAVCIAAGSRTPRDLPIPGRGLKGIHFAMDYLVRQNKILAGEPVKEDDGFLNAECKDVLVIGGGDTGSDCLGTALRQGAKSVLQLEIMPKPPAERAGSTPWPEWPLKLRESSSHKEGGQRRWCVTAKEFVGEDSVREVNAVEVEWSNSGKGYPAFEEKAGSEFVAPAQLVLLAMGFTGPVTSGIIKELGLKKDARGNLKVGSDHMTSEKGVFAAGDAARGQSLVVRAISDGLDTAIAMDTWLKASRS